MDAVLWKCEAPRDTYVDFAPILLVLFEQRQELLGFEESRYDDFDGGVILVSDLQPCDLDCLHVERGAYRQHLNNMLPLYQGVENRQVSTDYSCAYSPCGS